METQGLVILEALATGLPVISVKATCIPELVSDSVNGYIVNPGKVDEMAERIVYVLTHPDSASEFGRKGRSFVERHSIKHSLLEHEGLYKTIILEGTK